MRIKLGVVPVIDAVALAFGDKVVTSPIDIVTTGEVPVAPVGPVGPVGPPAGPVGPVAPRHLIT